MCVCVCVAGGGGGTEPHHIVVLSGKISNTVTYSGPCVKKKKKKKKRSAVIQHFCHVEKQEKEI